MLKANLLVLYINIQVMEQAVSLTAKGDGKRPTRQYTLQQLFDLQSKLMLVAGKATKGKDDVENFVEVSGLKVVFTVSLDKKRKCFENTPSFGQVHAQGSQESMECPNGHFFTL